MTIRDFALEGLEQGINQLLALDPKAQRELAALHGRFIRIDLRGSGLQFNFVPGHDGRVQLLGSIEGEPDATLSGSPIDLMRASDKAQGAAQLFAGHVQIDGDSGVAERFSTALGGLDIDWEEQLSHLIGDIAAHEIGRATRSVRREGERIADSSGQTLSEYLTEEARLLPHRFEIEDFLDEVDSTRDDVERLAARIELLENRRKGETR
jgi:ubiquinone biosynthesis protein UbiJ